MKDRNMQKHQKKAHERDMPSSGARRPEGDESGSLFTHPGTYDPFAARLPALVLEMRKEHEEVVAPRDWIPVCLLVFVPFVGAIVLFFMGYGKRNQRKNIQNYAMAASWISLLGMLSLGGILVFLMGHQAAFRPILEIVKRGVGGG